MKAFLPCSVPQLHSQTLIVYVYSFGDEIDSDSGLGVGTGTCSLPVKLSKMKRLMMEVLPTDWSPSKTILHLMAGLFYISNLYIISEEERRQVE